MFAHSKQSNTNLSSEVDMVDKCKTTAAVAFASAKHDTSTVMLVRSHLIEILHFTNLLSFHNRKSGGALCILKSVNTDA